jgi:DNA polymerase-3 subunit gamma/tau
MNMSSPQEYQVTARKWRPAEFASVVGQEHVTQTLKNAIRQDRVHHAYLFSGPRGVGKTTTARILAKALNCTDMGPDIEPCGVCNSCREITEGRSMDVVEIDGASNNSVEDIRKLRDNAKYPPVTGRYKLYIIDEVHMLSTSAFNALLKTLEEPPRHLVFVFATTEPHKVPATILSRCQRFDFRRMQIADIVGRLAFIAQQEGMNVEEDALVVIAKKGDGSMRDSQSIFDQVTSFCGQNVTYAQANEALNVIDQAFFFRVTDMMRSHDTAEAFAIVEQIMRIGYDSQEFLIGLAEHFRNFLSVLTTGSTGLLETAKLYIDRYIDESRGMEQGDMIRALHLTLATQQAIRSSSQPRLRLELALIQLAVMDSTVSLTQLLEKIDRLPDTPGGGGSGGGIQGAAPAPQMSAPAAESVRPSPLAAVKEQLRGAPPKSEAQSEKEKLRLDSFPTSAPLRQPMYTAERDVATAPAQPRGTSMLFVGEDRQVEYGGGGNGGAPSLRDVQRRWEDFLGFCNSDMPMLANTLAGSPPAEMYSETLRIYVTNEASLLYVNKNREALNQKLRSFFNATLNVEGALGAAPTPLQQESPSRGIAPGGGFDHPFVRGLEEMLEASRI